MPDIVDAATRSRMMSGIRGINTKPELVVRRALHAKGFRFRLHRGDLPGRPDLVFPRRNAILFVHGCFWHGHGCVLFKWPSTRDAFWRAKIMRNREVDARNEDFLIKQGWRVGVIWECALKGPARIHQARLVDQCSSWLRGTRPRIEIKGVGRSGKYKR